MRKAAVVTVLVGAYTLMFGILLLIVLGLTTAFADGWSLRAATKQVVDRAPQFSPDGSQIAFVRRRGGGERRLWVMSADGSDARPLARATRFSWTAGGGALLFAHGGRIFRVRTDGGNAVRVSGALRPPLRTSRHRTVFARGNHLFVRDAAGHETALT
jgi:dipeptidyl aminopeptidase/acylaminoacyl peptidase